MAQNTKAKTVKKKKKGKVVLTKGVVYISSTYNNTIVSIGDKEGNIFSWASAGRVGFKGPKKSTPFAASQVVRSMEEFIKSSGLKEIDVFVKGVGLGREAAIRAFSGLGVQIASIYDRTPIPHNGPRQKKPRRV